LVPEPDEEATEEIPPVGVHQLAGLLKQLARKASSKEERAEFADLLASAQPVLDYMEQRPAIEAASQAIEAHRADFDKLVADEEAYLERTRLLFAEDRFVPLRFTADEVERAFKKVGPLPPHSSDEQFIETVRKAMLHLADKERRSQAAMRLMMHLPDYVAANRPLDAWILQHCSYLTGEERGESNPFLFQMFSYGYDAWLAEKRGREAAMLRKAGMDVSRLEGMSMEEIDAWLQEQQADPAKLARMEELFLANPEQRAQAEANLKQLERDAHILLQREDATHLLLPPEDVEPWLPELNEGFASVCEQFPDLTTPSPSAAAGKAFMDAMVPLVRGMVAELFNPERIGNLAAQLKAYRNDRFASGDKKTAALANGALIYLKNEDEPGCNSFLCALGYLSLFRVLDTSAIQQPEGEPSPGKSSG
jgi:DNA-binding transcriptional MerR regulator